METTLELLQQAGYGALQLLAGPFYYIAVLIIVLHYFRQTRTERKLFHVRLHAWPVLLFRTVVAGLAAGAVISVTMAFIGVTITAGTIYWVWGTAAVLLLFRVRYLCFAYSVGLLGILQWGAGWWDWSGGAQWIATASASLAALEIPGLLLLVALLHAAEALFIRSQNTRLATPMFMEGKRGKLVGGYQLQGYWPVPLLLLVPAQTGSAAETALPWTPLLGGDLWSAGWMIAGLPMVVGFSEVTRSMVPQQRARRTSGSLLYYSLLLTAVAAAAAWWAPLTPVAALCALAVHEAIIWIHARKESEHPPLFVHDEQGLKVLAIVPGTPADELRIVAGEVIHKVNGIRVRTKDELHEALQENSAFCKLEVFNLEGQLKFVQRARFAGEHHQLGVILAPDDSAQYFAAAKPATLLDLFRRKGGVKSRDRSASL
ncbi:PDZ domain-containing protein [Paenibacillus tarimensis]